MADKVVDHERALRVTKAMKAFDMADKEMALSILANTLIVQVEVQSNRWVGVQQQEVGGEPGYKVGLEGGALVLRVPYGALVR